MHKTLSVRPLKTVYQIQPVRLLRRQFTQNLTFFVDSSFSKNLRNLALRQKLTLCVENRILPRISCFLGSKIEKIIFTQNQRIHKTLFIALLKLSICQIQPHGLLKALFTQNLTFLFENRAFGKKLRKLVLCLKPLL